MKYLLCRPLGGLNDILMRIYECYEYCKYNNRILLLDTKYNSFFKNSFDKYFTFNDSVEVKIIYNSDEIYKLINENNFSVFPNCLTNKLYDYEIEYRNVNMYIIGTEILPQIAFNKKYDEDVVLYNTFGGGTVGHYVLRHLRLNQFIIDEIKNRYSKISTSYVSIHIRNTDYSTDYCSLYEEHKSTIENNAIFLATDSKEVLDFFKSKNIKLYTFINEFNDNNLPIHEVSNVKNDKHTIIIDLLCDLVLLSLADRLIIPEIHYGFSRLAKILFNNKDVIYTLLNEPISSAKYKKTEFIDFKIPDLTGKKYVWAGGVITFTSDNLIMTTWGQGSFKWLNTNKLNIKWNGYSHTVIMDSTYSSYISVRDNDNVVGHGKLI